MPFDFSDAIKSVGEAFTSLFNLLNAKRNRQSETQILKELKKMEKAVNTAEKMFNIFFKYINELSPEDKDSIIKLLTKFQENN